MKIFNGGELISLSKAIGMQSLLGKPLSLGGGIALVQSASGTTADGSAGLTVNFGVPVTAGNSVIALISREATGGGFGTPSAVGGSGLTFVADSPFDGSTFGVAIAYLHTLSGGETGIEWTTTAVRASMQILEVSGLADAADEDTSTNTVNDGTLLNFNEVTPISASNLIVAIGAYSNGSFASGSTSPFTRLGTGTGGGSVLQEAVYAIQSSAAAQSSNMDITLDGEPDFQATAVAVFGAA